MKNYIEVFTLSENSTSPKNKIIKLRVHPSQIDRLINDVLLSPYLFKDFMKHREFCLGSNLELHKGFVYEKNNEASGGY